MVDRYEWTAPSAVPRPYRMRDRWSDYRWARADARKGIPLVGRRPESSAILDNAVDPNSLTGGKSDPAARGGDTLPLPVQYQPPDVHVPPDDAFALVTPYMDGLRHTCNEAIAGVYERFESSCDQLREELSKAESRREALLVSKAMAEERFDRVASQPN